MPLQPFAPASFKTFGDLLKYLRRRERLTQLELSIAVGYSESQISRLEQNQRLPDLAALKALFVPALHIEDEPEAATRLLELAESARQEEAPAPGTAPYKGLPYFEEKDAGLFFGREALTRQLAERVKELAPGDSPRFLAVVGASGSGKSSLMRAGLAVALREAGWEVRILAPGVHPLKTLAAQPLVTRRRRAAGETVLVVDQFEEAFTLCHEESERAAFIEQLLSLAEGGTGQMSIVIALRADFYSRCAQYPVLRQAVAAQQEYIGQMSTEELRRAIEEPAKRGGWEFEAGLVELLLKDIGTESREVPEPGALPLLSHALLALWERRRGRTLTFDGYARSGGVRGAIAETAESVFSDQLDERQQELAHHLFLRLTELGEGTEDTRRHASLNELVTRAEEAAQLHAVLDILAQARLITLGEDSAEVAHEALIREWGRLHEWLRQDREGLRLHRHLTEAAQEWEALGRDAGSLYRGARLAQAREWARANPERLNVIEEAFLAASREQEEHELLEREAQRQRELEAAQKLAEAEHRSAAELRRRNRVVLSVGAAALLLALLAGLFGVRSQASYVAAEAQRLAAEANSLYKSNGNPELVALLALHSMNLRYSAQGDEALERAASLSYPSQLYRGHTKLVWGVAFSPDGRYVLSGSEDGTARLWERQTGEQLRKFDFPAPVYQVAFSPDGGTILTNCADTIIRLWDPKTGKQLQEFNPGDFADAPVFSPDGKRVLAASRKLVVSEWDVETGRLAKQIQVPLPERTLMFVSPSGKYVLAVSQSENAMQLWSLEGTLTKLHTLQYFDSPFSAGFSPDEKSVVIGYAGGDIILWDTASGRKAQVFKGHTLAVFKAVLSPDETRLLSGGGDKTVRLWDAHTGTELLELSQADQVSAVAFSADGKYLLAGSIDGTIRLWYTQLHPELPVFKGHTSVVSAIAFSPDGSLLATGGNDGMRLWDAGDGQTIRAFPEAGTINYGVKFSPDGKYLLSGNWAGVVMLWDVSTGRRLNHFTPHTYGPTKIHDVAFTPDGRRIAAIGSDDGIFPATGLWDLQTGKPVGLPLFISMRMGESMVRVAFSMDGRHMLTTHDSGLVRIWDTSTAELVQTLTGHNGTVNGAAFSPDGKSVATAGSDRTVRLWNVKTGKEIRRFNGHTDLIWSVIFSPDGRMLATASADGTARLWDVRSGRELRRFAGHTAGVENVVFSPDGKYIATSSDDGTARLWDVDYHTIMQYLCSQLLRDLNDAERKLYNITDGGATCP